MPTIEVVRAFRFAIDPTADQVEGFVRHAGASRWAFNHALSLKRTSYEAYTSRRDAAVLEISGWSPEDLSRARHAKRGSDARKVLAGFEKVAAAAIRPELDGLSVDTRLWDHHRKIVFRWTSPAAQAREAKASPVQKERARSAYLALSALNPELAQLLEQRREDVRAVPDGKFAAARKAELAMVRAKLVELKLGLISKGALTPSSFDTQALWRAQRDKPADQGGSPWHAEVNSYAFLTGFDNADTAWKNWVDSCAGERRGRRVGFPRFKKRGRAADSFALFHDPKKPSIRLDGFRAVRLPTLGRVRLHGTTKRLARLVDRGHAVISSATLTRQGHRWYVSLLARVQQEIPVAWRHTAPDGAESDYVTPHAAREAAAKGGGTVQQIGRPTARQRTAGMIAVDLGVQPLAHLSAPLDPADTVSANITNPKYLAARFDALTQAQRAVARCAIGSKRRVRAVRRLAKLHHEVSARRMSFLHGVTKRLSAGAAVIAVEDLDLVSMSASGRGADVKVKGTLNRHLLDAGLGEIRRQLAYKTPWYGSTLIVLDKGEATSTKCSKCGERNPSSRPSDRHFTCGRCGLVVSRRDNAVRSIYQAARRKLATVAPGRGSTLKAPGGSVSPLAGDGGGQLPVKGKGPSGPADLSPR